MFTFRIQNYLYLVESFAIESPKIVPIRLNMVKCKLCVN
jgi:hypothetical protein